MTEIDSGEKTRWIIESVRKFVADNQQEIAHAISQHGHTRGRLYNMWVLWAGKLPEWYSHFEGAYLRDLLVAAVYGDAGIQRSYLADMKLSQLLASIPNSKLAALRRHFCEWDHIHDTLHDGEMYLRIEREPHPSSGYMIQLFPDRIRHGTIAIDIQGGDSLIDALDAVEDAIAAELMSEEDTAVQ